MTTKVIFDQWRDGYDDGEIDASNDVLTYLIRIWLTKDGIYKAASHPVTPGNFITLTRLEPGSEYNLQVLVQVENYEGKVCVADGFGRERVHTVPFRTSCPNKPPTPDRVNITDVKSTSFLVFWQDVSYKATCHIQYAVEVNKQIQTFQDVAWYRPMRLEPYTEYNIVVWAQMEKTTYSNRGPTNRVKTLPLPPSAPLGDLVLHDRTWKATWWPAPGDKETLLLLQIQDKLSCMQ
ncbi:uncharacterized protein LOC121860064 [Homarus americanus]|uniref:uncharacterized protein LOC121860064 n=1 Tax=Homarus americanus TaxID=6706 RepID=UPI001C47A8E1|nr:uncharacterized protein LOC121860064 [Homarus americanus]